MNPYAVEFDEFVNGHDCDCNCRYGFGLWCYDKDLELVNKDEGEKIMINLKEITEMQEELDKNIKELNGKQKELNRMIEDYGNQSQNVIENWEKNWEPAKGEDYYFIRDDSTIDDYTNNSDFDERIINYKRVFQTYELAEKWLEIDKYLKKESCKLNLELDDEDYNKYYIYYNIEKDVFDSEEVCDYCYLSKFYFEGEEKVEDILKRFTTDELKYYFNI